MRESSTAYDMIIVGGGLSGLVTAWMCLDRNTKLKILIVDASRQIGGDHTWSFNLSDVPELLRESIQPFIVHQWDEYDVVFPNRKRRLEIPYCSGNSKRLREIMQPFIKRGQLTVLTSQTVKSLVAGNKDRNSGHSKDCYAILEDGQKIEAGLILDARGFKPDRERILGYQKFVGLVVKTRSPHGLEYPVIMDATVPQIDGYRFIYCLPYGPDEMLIEDTYYSDELSLDADQVMTRVKQYASDKGWDIQSVERTEKGVLPITLAVHRREADIADQRAEIGLRGGFYHAVTGYSFPDAVKIAEKISDQIAFLGEDFDVKKLIDIIAREKESHLLQERFYRLLNRMLFRAARPGQRYKVLERFYGLSEPLIKRFYARESTIWDKIRILSGKPPVPIFKALANYSERAFITREQHEQ